MKPLIWLYAGFIVYIDILRNMDRKTRATMLVLLLASILSAMIGLPGTLVLLFVIFVLVPAINENVRQRIDAEYRKLSNRR